MAVPSAKLSSETKEQIKIITASTYNNMCACYIKQSKWSKCVDTSKKVLELDEKNLKVSRYIIKKYIWGSVQMRIFFVWIEQSGRVYWDD